MWEDTASDRTQQLTRGRKLWPLPILYKRGWLCRQSRGLKNSVGTVAVISSECGVLICSHPLEVPRSDSVSPLKSDGPLIPVL